jgi:CRISPR/Cas system CSM-associated protein Csm3 (group 7 of RAMP superfamily)
MTPRTNIIECARVTLQFRTPFMVGGQDAFDTDAQFVTDANDLPAIPGTSVAGALRARFLGLTDEKTTNRLFGYQRGNKGHGSRLEVTWAHIHNSRDLPADGLLTAGVDEDAVLRHARMATVRDHVRIGHLGAAEDRGKFDERPVPAGHRFTFEMRLRHDGSLEPSWQTLLGILCDPAFRLGGKTRRGYGAFDVVALNVGRFDLARPDDFQAWCSHPVALNRPAPSLNRPTPSLSPSSLPELANQADTVRIRLELRPEDFWFIGGGSDDAADLAPMTDSRVTWEDGKGTVGAEQPVLPATSLKGALAHRVAFHFNALRSVYADTVEKPDEVTAGNNEGVRQLFGAIKQSSDQREEGHPGRVFIDDLYIDDPGAQKYVNHVSIDRFTGGAIQGALFLERPFFGGGPFETMLTITRANDVSVDCRKALRKAIEDLVEGRLGIGSGTNRGNGFFSGSFDGGPQLDHWFNGGDA